jgi:hypothetical protein
MRVCSQPGCPQLIPAQGRCPEHARQMEHARGSRHARGYGKDHTALRAHLAPAVSAGQVKCWRCHEPIAAGEPWDLGHNDDDRTKYRGPEHVHCNRSAAGKHSHT